MFAYSVKKIQVYSVLKLCLKQERDIAEFFLDTIVFFHGENRAKRQWYRKIDIC